MHLAISNSATDWEHAVLGTCSTGNMQYDRLGTCSETDCGHMQYKRLYTCSTTDWTHVVRQTGRMQYDNRLST